MNSISKSGEGERGGVIVAQTPAAMDRRQFAIAAAAVGGRLLIDPFAPFSALRAAATQNADALSPAYAESVEISGLSEDGASEFEVRLARFPPRSSGTLWATVCLADQVYNVTLDDVRLADPGRTRVEEADARFEVSEASGTSARLERHRDGSLVGSAHVAVSAHRSVDPPPGAGSEAVTIEARFESATCAGPGLAGASRSDGPGLRDRAHAVRPLYDRWSRQVARTDRKSPAIRGTLHLSHRDGPRSRAARGRTPAGAVWFCVDGR